MALPETVRVKLSSEDAGTIAILPVVVQDMPLRELVELMLGVTGKDPPRIHELLLRGTLVSGASRFRWEGWEADPSDIEALLATYPDPQPGRPFSGDDCVRVLLHGPGCRIDLPCEVGAKRRFLRKNNFWDALIEIVAGQEMHYVGYSYKEKADHYRVDLSPQAGARLRKRAGLLAYTALARQMETAAIETVELFTERRL
jgi:hypothetical protein